MDLFTFVTVDDSVKIKESEKIDKYLDPARELKKAVEQEGDSVYYLLSVRSYEIQKETRRIWDQRNIRDHTRLRLEYFEESRTLEETCHSVFVKTLQSPIG